MPRQILTAGALALGLATSASASTVLYSESFDAGTGGWTLIDKAGDTDGTQNTLTVGAGFIEATDVTGGVMRFVGPAALTGDLSSFAGSELFLRIGQFAPATLPDFSRFGRITIRSGGTLVRADALSGPAALGFREGTIRLDAATFDTDEATFQSVLGNVTSFEVIAESLVGNGEVVRFDEISISAVPVPAAGLLLLGALGGMVGLRRRKSNDA